jgi:hypothetical protein
MLLIAARSGQSIAQANRRSSQTAHHNAQRNQTSAQLIFRTAQRNRSPVQIDRPSAQSNRLSGQTSLQIARCNYYLTQPNHPLFERTRLVCAAQLVRALQHLCHIRNPSLSLRRLLVSQSSQRWHQLFLQLRSLLRMSATKKSLVFVCFGKPQIINYC